MADASHDGIDRIDRRRFLGKAAVGAAAGSLAACDGGGAGGPGVVTHPNIQWRLASSFPQSLDAIYGASERLATRLEAITEGRFRIQPYAAGEIVPGLQVMDAAQQGTVQVGHTASYYYVGKNPVLAFETGVPFGLTARQQQAWLFEGGGLDLMNEVFDDFNLIVFPAGNTGAQMGGWFKREVNSLSDLRGLKMRIPSLGGEVMSRLGVTVQVLAAGDIYPALERGAIDATEWVGPYDDEKLGFHKAAQYYYYPGWWEPGPSLTFMVNRRAWDQLPASYQEAFRAAAIWASNGTQTIYDARNPAALQRLVASGVQLRPFSTEIMRASHDMAFSIMQDNASANADYRRIFDAWNQFREDSFRWFSTAEKAYEDFVYDG
jgi:TRAP-type mannitol/chloroaromatic compound transport system substrate-binding protein